jgi:voltage-gated potassium channel
VRRLLLALASVAVVILVGTVGYVVIGLSALDALYQTVTTVFTVGFREVADFDTAVEKVYTMLVIVVGVGTVLYTATLTLELVLEGHVGNAWGRRRMQRDIDRLENHAIVCGWGRVGKAAAEQLARDGQPVVVIDRSEDRLVGCPFPFISGDATQDEILRAAGVLTARSVVAALDDDAGSVYVVLTARTLNPDVFVIARSRTDDAEPKFVRAGADRVVNPQRLGGNRIAAFAVSPYVVEFLDVVMHEDALEFRMVDVEVRAGSALEGSTIADTRAAEGGAAVLLALRTDGAFVTDPQPETVLKPGDVLIAVGTSSQVQDLRRRAGSA